MTTDELLALSIIRPWLWAIVRDARGVEVRHG